MTRFRFKVSDSAARVRVGHISARTMLEARQGLELKGFTVLELTAGSASRLEIQAPSVVDPLRPKPVGASYKPGVLEFLEEVESDPRRRRGVLSTLLLIGLVLSFLHGAGPLADSSSIDETTPPVHELSLLISGRVQVAPEQRQRATLHFWVPEVPLYLVRSYDQIVDDQGAYRLEYDCQVGQIPAEFAVALRVDDREVDGVEELPLRGEPLTGEAPLLKTRQL